MGTTLAPAALSAFAPRTVIVDENTNPVVSEVRPGGILVWTNRSTKFRHFAIKFVDNEGRGPASPGDTLAGTGSIVIHVILEGTFDYTIQYGTVSAPAAGPVSTTFAVHSCVGC
jgi:hypothetical protein